MKSDSTFALTYRPTHFPAFRAVECPAVWVTLVNLMIVKFFCMEAEILRLFCNSRKTPVQRF
jgi:hypothetical protein